MKLCESGQIGVTLTTPFTVLMVKNNFKSKIEIKSTMDFIPSFSRCKVDMLSARIVIVSDLGMVVPLQNILFYIVLRHLTTQKEVLDAVKATLSQISLSLDTSECIFECCVSQSMIKTSRWKKTNHEKLFADFLCPTFHFQTM